MLEWHRLIQVGFTERVSSTTAIRTARVSISDAVLSTLTSDEQSLRSIRAQVAVELNTDPSEIASQVNRALTKLVTDRKVERPRRGFYRALSTAEAEPPATIPTQIARPLAANRLTVRPRSHPRTPSLQVEVAKVPAADSSPAKPVSPVVPLRKPEQRPDAPVVHPEAPAAAHVQAPVVKQELKVDSGVKPGVPVQAKVEPKATPKPSWHRKHTSKVLGRRERKWTPEGSMGFEGMILIILWFVAAGVLLFLLNNVYGVIAAVAAGMLLWLFRLALRPSHDGRKRARIRTSSAR